MQGTYHERRLQQTDGRGDPLHVERADDNTIAFDVYLYDRDGAHIATVRSGSEKAARLIMYAIGLAQWIDRAAK